MKSANISLLLVSVLLFVSSAAAIDFNSSKSLQYYGNGNALDFQVGTGGDIEVFGNLNLKDTKIYGGGGSTLSGFDVIKSASGSQCGTNEFLNGNGNCDTDTDTDTTLSETNVERYVFDTDNDEGGMNVGGNLDLNGNDLNDAELITNNNGGLIYNTSSGRLYANKPNVNGGGIWISDDGGFYDYNDGWIRFEGTNGLDMNGNTIRNGAICPDGSCGKSSYETFDSGGIGTTNIYSGSGGEVDFQSTTNFNGNTVKNINAQSFRLPVGTDAW